MRKKILYIFVVLMLLGFSSCKDANKKALPSVTGRLHEVVVVIDKAHWETSVGKEIQKTFLVEYPNLPQSEPMFDLVNVPYSAMSKILETHRNLVMTKFIKSRKEPKIIVKEDVYSYHQLVVTLIAKDTTEMIGLIQKNKEKIRAVFSEKEKQRTLQGYKAYKEKDICAFIEKKFGMNVIVPMGYSLDAQFDDFAWLAHDTRDYSLGLFVYEYTYKDTSDFSLDSLLLKRDQFTKKYVPASRQGSYMKVERNFPTKRKAFIKKGKYYCMLKGLWKTEKDFMGGPFLSIAMVDEKNGKIKVVDGFFYGPHQKKRNHMIQLETVIRSAKVKIPIKNEDKETGKRGNSKSQGQ